MPHRKIKCPGHWSHRLTEQQAIFVNNYFKEESLGSAVKAATMAGYSESFAKKLTGNPVISRAIDKRRLDRLQSLDGDAIRAALSRLALCDMRNFLTFEDDGTARIDLAKARKLGAMGQLKEYKVNADGSVVIKLHDPLRPLEILAKIVGMLKDHVEHSGEVKFNPITLDGDKEVAPGASRLN